MATLLRQRNVLLTIVSVESALLLVVVWGAVGPARTPGAPAAARAPTALPSDDTSPDLRLAVMPRSGAGAACCPGRACWRVSGAGDPSYNGHYDRAGLHRCRTYYVHECAAGKRYLYWSEGGYWALGPSPGFDVDEYRGAGLGLPAGPWVELGGLPPGPELSTAEPPDAAAIDQRDLEPDLPNALAAATAER